MTTASITIYLAV